MNTKTTTTLTAVALTAALATTGCASTPKPGAGSALDATTTATALSMGFQEANPILSGIGNPVATAVASIGLKAGAKALLAPKIGEEQADINIETGGLAAGAFNLALLAGANPILGGVAAIAAGTAYFNHRQDGVESRDSVPQGPVTTVVPGGYYAMTDSGQHAMMLRPSATLQDAAAAAQARYDDVHAVKPIQTTYTVAMQ